MFLAGDSRLQYGPGLGQILNFAVSVGIQELRAIEVGGQLWPDGDGIGLAIKTNPALKIPQMAMMKNTQTSTNGNDEKYFDPTNGIEEKNLDPTNSHWPPVRGWKQAEDEVVIVQMLCYSTY